MKKYIIPIFVAALFAYSCNKGDIVVDITNANALSDVELTINVPNSITKTYIVKDGSSYNPYWNNGDKLCVMNLSDPATKCTFTNGAADGAAASFTGSIGLAAGDNTLLAFYPQDVAKIDRSTTTYKLSWTNNDQQTLPSLDSYDKSHDILVGKPVVVHADAATSKTSVEMQFRRVMAVAKVVLTDNSTNDYVDDAHVTSIKLTSSTTNLAGRIGFETNTDDAVVTGIDGTTSKSVTANYAGGDFTIDGTNAAYIILPPVTLATGSTLTVDVETDKAGLTISKEITLTQDLVFNPGAVRPLQISITDACVEFLAGAVLSVDVPSVSNVTHALTAGLTIPDAYTIVGGTDGDINISVDGTVVSSASVSGGTVTYSVAANAGVSRSGWIGLQAGEGAVQKITVNQNYNPDNVTIYTWDFSADKPTKGTLTKNKYYSYVAGTYSTVDTHTAENTLYIYAGTDSFKFQSKDTSGITPKETCYYMSYGGNSDYLFFNSSHSGLLTVYATISNTTGDSTMGIKVDGATSGSNVSLDYYSTGVTMLNAKPYTWSIANGTGIAKEIQIIKVSGSKSPWVYKIVYESLN